MQQAHWLKNHSHPTGWQRFLAGTLPASTTEPQQCSLPDKVEENMKTFLSELTEEEKNVINKMRELILEIDSKVKEKVGDIMSSKYCFIYEEEGVFKYGLAKTKNHFSFHSMVMYANPEVRNFIEERSKSLKIQKGCVNFSDVDKFPLDLFKEFLSISEKADFSPVINHYKSKK